MTLPVCWRRPISLRWLRRMLRACAFWGRSDSWPKGQSYGVAGASCLTVGPAL